MATSVVEVIVEYRTSGGRHLPHTDAGRPIEVILDGEKRTPKTDDFGVIARWLMNNDYDVVGHKWLDRAGYVRRRKSTYKKES